MSTQALREAILENVFGLPAGESLPVERAEAAFDDLDADKSGDITTAEMARGMAGGDAPAQEVVNMAARVVDIFDENQDGLVSRAEFVGFLCPGAGQESGGGEEGGGGGDAGDSGGAAVSSDEGAFIRQFLRQQILERSDAGTFKESKVRAVFEELDVDGSGEIDLEELRGALVSFGLDTVSEAEVALIMSVLDLDGSGAVSLDEFLKLFTDDPDEAQRVDASGLSANERRMLREFLLDGVFKVTSAKQLHEEHVKKVFKKADADDSGSVTRDEFAKAAKALNFGELGERELDLCMAVFDKDGDGEVNYQEWSEFFFDGKSQAYATFGMAGAPGKKQKELLDVLHSHSGHDDLHEKIRQFYDKHDKSKVKHVDRFVQKHYTTML
eukprot:g2124.t1